MRRAHWGWQDPLTARVLLPDGAALPALTHSFSTFTGPDAAADLTKFSLAALGRERNRAHHALDVASELAAELGTRVQQGEIR